MRARTLLKETVYGCAHALGLPRFLGAHNGESLTILTYHSFGPATGHPYLNRMPVARLKSQIEYLRRYYDIVAVEEGLDKLEQQDRPWAVRPMLALTIDDGYGDNYDHLYPVLRNLDIPATIFLATDYLDSGLLPWPTRISAMLHFATVREIPAPFALPLATAKKRSRAGRALRDHFSRLDGAVRENELQDLERSLAPRGFQAIKPLTWDQVREMRKGGVRFGSHTRLHGWLDRLSEHDVEAELILSKTRIESETQSACHILAYPNGNWSGTVAAQTARVGYKFALTQDRGVNHRADLRSLELRRIEIPFNERIGSFSCRVGGIAL